MAADTLQDVLEKITGHLRQIMQQYPKGIVTPDQRSQLETRFQAVLQAYMWKGFKNPTNLKKKIYRKLSLLFHPDKFAQNISKNKQLFQKEDFDRISEIFSESKADLDKDKFFKILGNVNSDYQEELPSLADALAKPKARRAFQKPTPSATYSTRSSYGKSYTSKERASYSRTYAKPNYSRSYSRTQDWYSSSGRSQYNSKRHYYPNAGYSESGWNSHSYHSDYTYKTDYMTELARALQCHDISKAILCLNHLDIKTILTTFSQASYTKYLKLFLQNLSQYITQDLMQDAFSDAIQRKNYDAATIFAQNGLNIEQIYRQAMKDLDNQTLYVLFEICPKNHLIWNELFSVKSKIIFLENRYHLRRLIQRGLIDYYDLQRLSTEELYALSSPATFQSINDGYISLRQALTLRPNEIELINYPGFFNYVKYCGSFTPLSIL